jgi:hypothetical protein
MLRSDLRDVQVYTALTIDQLGISWTVCMFKGLRACPHLNKLVSSSQESLQAIAPDPLQQESDLIVSFSVRVVQDHRLLCRAAACHNPRGRCQSERSEAIASDLIYHSHRELVSGVGVLYNIGQEVLRTADIVPFPRGGRQGWGKRARFTPHLNPPTQGGRKRERRLPTASQSLSWRLGLSRGNRSRGEAELEKLRQYIMEAHARLKDATGPRLFLDTLEHPE